MLGVLCVEYCSRLGDVHVVCVIHVLDIITGYSCAGVGRVFCEADVLLCLFSRSLR